MATKYLKELVNNNHSYKLFVSGDFNESLSITENSFAKVQIRLKKIYKFIKYYHNFVCFTNTPF